MGAWELFLDREVEAELRDLIVATPSLTPVELEGLVDERLKKRPRLLVELFQYGQVTSFEGRLELQARWRAGIGLVDRSVMESLDGPEALAAKALAPGATSAPGVPAISDWVEILAQRYVRNTGTFDIKIRAKYVFLPSANPGRRPGFIILVGRDRAIGERVQHVGLWALGASSAAVALFLLVSAFVTSRFVVSRISAINDTASEIIRGDLSRRIAVSDANDEFDNLSTTLNRMLDQIERLLIGMKEVTDNIAHDLRTPLQRLQNRIAVALLDVRAHEGDGPREALEAARKEADRLLATFNALLSIARIESGTPRDRYTRADIAVILRDIAELYEPAAEEQGVRLTTRVPQGIEVPCNRDLIVQALSNLVDNALKHAPDGSHVELAARIVQPGRGQRALEISVADEGPGIPAKDRERVLKRFERLERERGTPGSGLGLSLVNAIVLLHEGTLTLEDGAHGHGLVVRILLPLD